MQIDFHHGVTYVTARLAGFSQAEAEIVAYAAQYVDDATSSGTIQFHNRALYHRISSAHKMLDKRNVEALANHEVWLPFHFLPGNDGKQAGENHEGGFIKKIVCRPDSPIARDMVAACIKDKDKAYGLHRLGVTMHVYADTWAHQGFAGVLHDINDVENAEETSGTGVFSSSLGRWLRDALDDTIPPLGHGRANVFPDMPFLSWEYENGHKEIIKRNNTEDFCTAADSLCKSMQRYRLGDPDAVVEGLNKPDADEIRALFAGTREKDGEKRHKIWLQAIADGTFSFGNEQLNYKPRGKASWKAKALGMSHDRAVQIYDDQFLKSDWKNFHDAIQAHRFQVVHDILPRYGICAA